MGTELFGQLAMYIGGFGISDNFVKQMNFNVRQKYIFYCGSLFLSYLLFHA